MHPYNNRQLRYTAALLSALIVATGSAKGQQAPSAAPSQEPQKKTEVAISQGGAPSSPSTEDDVIELTPFEVAASDEGKGYVSSTTLAGTRLNTELRDLGNSVSVINSQFMKDINATDNNTLLNYTLNTEVGNYYGNFAGTGDASFLDESPKFINSNTNTRVRGLAQADNARNLVISSIPWEGYNVDGVDLQRGPNSMLFGQGSPAGTINVRLKEASFKDSNEVSVRGDTFGSMRAAFDVNKVILKGQLAIRIDGVASDEKFKQKPAFDDQRRLYGTVRWEPEFLKKNGMRTVIKANYENGKVSSNRPRSLPPVDLITPWFLTGTYKGVNLAGQEATYKNLNRETFIPSQLVDNNTQRANHGQTTHLWNGGLPASNIGKDNTSYNPWIGNFGSQYGGLLSYFNGDSSTQLNAFNAEPSFPYGIDKNGAIDKGVGGMPFQRPGGIATMAAYAKNAGLPFSKFGLYKDRSLTDSSVFNFYTNLLDGPNKKEWQKFNAKNLDIFQTFFNDKVGINYTYASEHWLGGQLSLLSGERQAIYVDINKVYGDGTPLGKNGEPFADGTPNANVGRAFVSDNGIYGNTEQTRDSTTHRVLTYVRHNFAQQDKKNLLYRALGEQTLEGIYTKEKSETKDQAWQRYAVDENYAKFIDPLNWQNRSRLDNAFVPNTVIYLGGSLINSSTASGANLPRPSAVQIPTSGVIRTFDSHWNKPTDSSAVGYVDPAAAWYNDYYPSGLYPDDPTKDPGSSTQSENPANYVGWKNVPYTITDSEAAPGNRDALTFYRRDVLRRNTAKALLWQGKMWNGAIVGTYGIRKDKPESDDLTNNNENKFSQSFKSTLALSRPGERTSKSWMIVGHLSEFPVIGDILKKAPVDISLSYNRSTNFRPESVRRDLYGETLPLPGGKTNDLALVIETRDGKYSLKINKFHTALTNDSSNAYSGAWFIGSSQAWAGNWANRFEFDWSTDTESGKIDNPPGWQLSEWNYAQAPNETAEQAVAREQRAISGWRTWQKSVDPRFYTAWGINLNDHTKSITANTPGGFTVTEDSVSKGYEIELTAQPTKNWRLTINASKVKASRANIGGKAFTDFVKAYQKALLETGAGDLRIWWGGAGNDTTLFQWQQNVGAEYAQRSLQEGTAVPELRDWHINAITNYNFDDGKLKGFFIGGGMRYESGVVIGYPPVETSNPDVITFDLAKPYKGPSETNYDLWFGYSRRLSAKVDWTIQVNARNLFVGNELIPITVQPDGSAAGFRIKPPQVWSLTNTFKF